MRLSVATLLILLFGSAATSHARVWTDSTGLYTIEADLVGFDDEHVIVQRQNQELGAFPIKDLSVADKEYLKSKEAIDIHADRIDRLQTWTSKDGLKVIGRVVDFAQRSMTIQERRGRIYVNDTVWENVPQFYQKMMPMVIGHLENEKMEDTTDFEIWVKGLLGAPKTYDLEGVVFELENGNEYGIPFFMFSDKDQQVLKPGYEAWKNDKDDHEKTDDHAFRLQSLAASYQQNEKINQQIAMMNLNMNAINAGLTDAWEVTLYPAPGNPYPPRWVVALGRNSLQATQNALRANPGFVDGPVRRLSRRRR